jgi:hypothetical protein
MNRLKKKWWMFLILSLLIIQFIQINKAVPKTHPKDDYLAIVNISPELKTKIISACYDCHSYQTEYPWYAHVAPLSWWIKGHIDHGREKLNFSIWNGYSEKRQNHKLEECVEKLEKGQMPLKSFTWMHSEAKLTKEERDAMIAWFKG